MRKLYWLLLLPVALLGGWWFLDARNNAPTVPVTKPRRETLISNLPTNGKVEPIEWVSVRVDSPGLVVKVPVQEGQSVRQGALLAQVGTPGALDQLRGAQAREEQIRTELGTLSSGGRPSDLTDIQNSLNRAHFDRDQAAREYNSLKRLQEKQAATAVDVESARARLRQHEIEIESLERKRSSLVSKGEVAGTEARVREAQASVGVARSRLAQDAIRSPMSGVIFSLPARPGTFLNAGDLVASIGKLDQLRVRVYVDEPELGRVAVGQPVKITWSALPGRSWMGTVEKKPVQIAPLGTRQVGEVLCTIDNPGGELVPGTNVDAEIQTSVAQNALTIPKDSLHRESGTVGVYVVTKENTLSLRKVVLGISNVTRAQILSGLNENDFIALPSEIVLKAGERVKPVQR